MAAELIDPALVGVAAGLAVALTPGPVGLLLVDVAVRGGRRRAVAAGAGIATVDAAYAGASAWAGAAAMAVLMPVRPALTVLAGCVLAVLALAGLRRARRPPQGTPERSLAQLPPARSYAAFVAMTLVNPTTLAVFFTIATGTGETLAASDSARLAFVAGAGGASGAWHAVLAFLGASLGRLPQPVHVAVATGCRIAVLMLGVRMALTA